MGHVSNPPFHPTKIAAAWRAQTQPDNPAARGIRRSGGPVPSATPYRNDLKPLRIRRRRHACIEVLRAHGFDDPTQGRRRGCKDVYKITSVMRSISAPRTLGSMMPTIVSVIVS